MPWSILPGGCTLGLLYEGGALLIEQVLLAFTGATNFLADVVVSFAVGALANPLRRRIDQRVARVFNRRKYEAEQQIEAFGRQLRRDLEIMTMPEELEEAVHQRIERAWEGMSRRSSHARAYRQERLFP